MIRLDHGRRAAVHFLPDAISGMLSRRGYEALSLIYDAATDLGRWRRALDAAVLATDAKAAALVIRQPRSGARNLFLMSTPYLDFSRTLSGTYYGLWLGRLQEADWSYLAEQAPLRPCPDTETGAQAEVLDTRADYAFLRRKVGIGRRLGLRLNEDRLWFDAISFGFPGEVEAVPARASAEAALLAPHLSKAVELGRTFALLKARFAATLAALDSVQVGLVVALPGGAGVVRNAEARRIFDLSDGIGLGRDGRLACHDADLDAELKAIVSAACATAQGEDTASEGLMAVPRPSGADPFLVDVAPLADSSSEIERDLVGALVTIVDPTAIPDTDLRRFSTLYGLTSAETEVCALVLEGLTDRDIAERRSTAPVTVKNQVAAILSKTGAARRAGLIRLVLRTHPPVRP